MTKQEAYERLAETVAEFIRESGHVADLVGFTWKKMVGVADALAALDYASEAGRVRKQATIALYAPSDQPA
jgi:hypothetical protein